MDNENLKFENQICNEPLVYVIHYGMEHTYSKTLVI